MRGGESKQAALILCAPAFRPQEAASARLKENGGKKFAPAPSTNQRRCAARSRGYAIAPAAAADCDFMRVQAMVRLSTFRDRPQTKTRRW
jgi:hypothetical protein